MARGREREREREKEERRKRGRRDKGEKARWEKKTENLTNKGFCYTCCEGALVKFGMLHLFQIQLWSSTSMV